MAFNLDKFAILVDIPDILSVEQHLILPGIMKNYLSPNCKKLTLVDGVSRETTALVFHEDDVSVRIADLGWTVFVDTNIIQYLCIRKLCFRKLGNDMFQVLCFNSTGKERIRNDSGTLMMQSCLVQASENTVDQQYIPCRILTGLNKKSKRKPIMKAKLFGPEDIGYVHVDYKFDEGNSKYEKWQAVGFSGPEWSKFVIRNGIKSGYTMLFDHVEKHKFIVDVFNADGIAVPNRSSGAESEAEDVWRRQFVEQRIIKTGKNIGKQEDAEDQYFVISFPKHPLKTKRLTIPKEFVRHHSLFMYEKAVLVYRKKKYPGKLDIRKDRRRPEDVTHLHFILDWEWMDQI